MKSLYVKASDAWVLYFAATLVIGVCQVSIFAPAFGIAGAHGTAIVLELVILSVVGWILVKRAGPELTAAKSLVIGFEWLALTVVAQFCVGHFILGGGWNALLAEYDFRSGRFGLVTLAWQVVVPIAAYRILAARRKRP